MRTALEFRERKRDSSSLVYVLHKTCNQAFSRHSRASTVKKCTKKRGARGACKVVVLRNKPIASLTSSLPSPSSLLKVPIYGDINKGAQTFRWLKFKSKEGNNKTHSRPMVRFLFFPGIH